MFQLPGHLLQKLLYNLVSSLASLEQFSQHLSEMLCPELKSSESLLNKIQPNVVDCLFFQLTFCSFFNVKLQLLSKLELKSSYQLSWFL